MIPELVVTEKLTKDEVRSWFRKLAAAPKPATAKE
jgi:hypothetical protein